MFLGPFKNGFFLVIVSLFLVLGLARNAVSCSAVFIDKGGTKIVGRNMDWKTGDGKVVVNQRGINKKAEFLQDESIPAEWRSVHGSVTFDLEMKFNFLVRAAMFIKRITVTSGSSCGMNEKGLYGGSFWLHGPPDVKYEKADGRPSVNDWELLQYILDTSANVKEAVGNIKKVRVSGFKEGSFETDLHWFIADPSGDSAVIEYPEGKLSVHRPSVPPVITNSYYEHSREYSKEYVGFGGTKDVPFDNGEMTSENRYIFAATSLTKILRSEKLSVKSAFDAMKSVTQTNVRHAQTSQAVTQWTSAYDLNKKEIYWISRTNPNIRSVKLSDVDFSRSVNNISVDINTLLSGDIANSFR